MAFTVLLKICKSLANGWGSAQVNFTASDDRASLTGEHLAELVMLRSYVDYWRSVKGSEFSFREAAINLANEKEL